MFHVNIDDNIEKLLKDIILESKEAEEQYYFDYDMITTAYQQMVPTTDGYEGFEDKKQVQSLLKYLLGEK